ncbi:Vitamin B12 import ATP-binding protein BtuD [Mesoplasma sp. JKS002658]|uniref:oligopeptide ABC transporter ATP-binding protein OppD n=1 Tax=Mesoplasma whartonense TaxID=2878854 RepID=UPI002022A167|nr:MULTISPECIES: oligopeptide ABC transporter ATP-binding protein OppD [unclassified Mesoplasma]MCL8211319.1 Vitamin B12 import ATP-binding protein BtuD [Mesoplasma sp. JKS002664]MCL8212172.1 Vitamin B12 import ATP-binding protein BtuD [Mesoplasma sp. JKS002662]MCL8212564.1 Vitamin B12 import ATP-binding protein BtuD [Mesoplasma sp. JKS002661]MCL8214299.1 Vitamin B12 import ATP-binding protein BtuD [Mesoplasma sp. JKS002658]MCL8214657.1 Vitamin B12 import ATP-binding protein BtuD [Mesoplasma s
MPKKQRVVLSIQDLVVKFRVRGRSLTAIRNISFDIYEGETVAIVGESGSGKSVLTKTLTDMLEANGYIAQGSIGYYPSMATKQDLNAEIRQDVDLVQYHRNALDSVSRTIIRRANKRNIRDLKKQLATLMKRNPRSELLKLQVVDNRKKLVFQSQEENKGLVEPEEGTFEALEELELQVNQVDPQKMFQIQTLEKQIQTLEQESYNFEPLKPKKHHFIQQGVDLLVEAFSEQSENKLSSSTRDLIQDYYEKLINLKLLKTTEVYLKRAFEKILATKKAKLSVEEVDFISETWSLEKRRLWTKKIKSEGDLKRLRGGTIATVFQDPMTSLNPLLTIGYQLIEAILAHQDVSHQQAKLQAISLLEKVGIPNAEKRMKDIPGQYSGGMRQRVVIAIALACKPKILICDEPTTALDVTIQAQILNLIKDLKKEYGFTVLFITHDLGVVANIADRVAVVYAGQIIEYGLTKEIFEDPKHPYTWALLSSLPQLGKAGEDLFAIDGTPPSLFNKIHGDAFAPRNKYALSIDYLYEPPFFKVSSTHFAKTWLLDSRAPEINKPVELNRLKEAIQAQKVGD